MEKDDVAPRRRLLPTPITPEEANAARRHAILAPEAQREATRKYHDDMARRARDERQIAQTIVPIAVDQQSPVDTKIAAMTQRVEQVAREHAKDGMDDHFDTHVGLYGELTAASLDLLIAETMGIDPARDWFFDIGSGFGKPCFHVALRTGIHCTGIEFQKERAWMARHLQSHMVRDFARELQARVDFIKQDMYRQVAPLPYTIYFSYDLGWRNDPPWPAKISELFLLSERARLLISFLPPSHYPRLRHLKSVTVDTTGVPPEHPVAHVYVRPPVMAAAVAPVDPDERPAKRPRLACFQCNDPAPEWRCAQCKEATYCNVECQERHWREGGHAASCGPL
jgi:SAM-dependent methyltransferase